MLSIYASNVGHALATAIDRIITFGDYRNSRNGPVLVYPEPVVTTYINPLNKVLISRERNPNPIFHVMEALWMLAGRRDVEYVAQFNNRMTEYSDDGVNFHGAYGYRWRNAFTFDQLEWIVEELNRDWQSRRCVLTMWDARMDGDALASGETMLDVPCNTHAYFRVDRQGQMKKLSLTVCCRSNDAMWGAYGANAVHFSMLLEYMASRLGMLVGKYHQMSNNLHVYTDHFGEEKLRRIALQAQAWGTTVPPEMATPVSVYVPLVTVGSTWGKDLHDFLEYGDIDGDCQNDFFTQVAEPMLICHRAYKEGDLELAKDRATRIQDTRWRVATILWLREIQSRRGTK